MQIWVLIFAIIIFCIILNKRCEWALPVALAVSSAADVYGIPIGNTRFSAFSVYIFISSIFIAPKFLNLASGLLIEALISPLSRLLIIFGCATFFINLFISVDYFINLQLGKFLVFFFQAFIIFFLYLDSQNSIESYFKKLLISILFINLAIIAFQKFGPHIYFHAASTTYAINEIRESGWGFGRPYGLSREPAHLVLVELLSLTIAANISFFAIFITFLTWFFIANWSETRSIFLVAVIFSFYYICFFNKYHYGKYIYFGIAIPLMILIVLMDSRLSTVMNFLSDESTLIRYGTLLAIAYHGLAEPFLPVSYGGQLLAFCSSDLSLFRPFENICTYRDIRLNWSLDFIFALPYYGVIFLIVLIYRNEGIFQFSILISLLLSGLIFYIWANPGAVIALAISIIHSYVKKTPNKDSL